MSKYRKTIAILLGHVIVCLIACVAWRFTRPLPLDVLAPLVTGYRIRSALLLCISLLPPLFISSLLVGFSIEFSANADQRVGRWSDVLFSYLKEAYILLLVCLAVFVGLSEGIVPVLQKDQKQAAVRTSDYHERMALARQFESEGRYAEAELQAHSALVSWPNDTDATVLLEQIQSERVESPAQGFSGTVSAEATGADIPSGMTVLDALDRALAAEKKNDFYNMHYYATIAVRLAPATDPNRETASRLAARAWNEIMAGQDRLVAEGERSLFDRKKEGYNAIQNGDYLRAYYLFLELHDQLASKKEGQVDADVERFLSIAKKGVLQSVFFIDETVDMNLYESFRDVFFVIRHPDGSSVAFYARGVTYTKSGGKDVAYLRDFEYASFARDGKLVYRISDPYAKMFQFAAGNRQYLQPELLLRSVNRSSPGSERGPTVLDGSVPESEKSILVIDMDFRDFDMIVDANRGPETMSIVGLWSFASRAERYGFSRTVFLREIAHRLAEPFLMLIIAMYALIVGWKFRLGKGVLFKFWWIAAVPAFFAISYFAFAFVRYVVDLCGFAVISQFPGAAVSVLLIALALWFIAVSVHFLSQRSD